MYHLELVSEDDEFAIGEARLAADQLHSVATGIAEAETVNSDYARRLAFTRYVNRAIGTIDGSLTDAAAFLETVSLERPGPVRVRARDVRGRADIDTAKSERVLGGVLHARGYDIDLERPQNELRALATPSNGEVRWYLGWKDIEPERTYSQRTPPKRPFEQPGTMDPMLARAIVNLSGVNTGERFFDPMCGPGSLLIEAALVGARPIGGDVQSRMVSGAQTNLRSVCPDARVDLVQASADAFPVTSVAAVAFDAPYGRQSPIAHSSAEELIIATLDQAAQITDQLVAVFDRSLQPIARDCEWTIREEYARPVHRSLTRYIAVLSK